MKKQKIISIKLKDFPVVFKQNKIKVKYLQGIPVEDKRWFNYLIQDSQDQCYLLLSNKNLRLQMHSIRPPIFLEIEFKGTIKSLGSKYFEDLVTVTIC